MWIISEVDGYNVLNEEVDNAELLLSVAKDIGKIIDFACIESHKYNYSIDYDEDL